MISFLFALMIGSEAAAQKINDHPRPIPKEDVKSFSEGFGPSLGKDIVTLLEPDPHPSNKRDGKYLRYRFKNDGKIGKIFCKKGKEVFVSQEDDRLIFVIKADSFSKPRTDNYCKYEDYVFNGGAIFSDHFEPKTISFGKLKSVDLSNKDIFISHANIYFEISEELKEAMAGVGLAGKKYFGDGIRTSPNKSILLESFDALDTTFPKYTSIFLMKDSEKYLLQGAIVPEGEQVKMGNVFCKGVITIAGDGFPSQCVLAQRAEFDKELTLEADTNVIFTTELSGQGQMYPLKFGPLQKNKKIFGRQFKKGDCIQFVDSMVNKNEKLEKIDCPLGSS